MLYRYLQWHRDDNDPTWYDDDEEISIQLKMAPKLIFEKSNFGKQFRLFNIFNIFLYE